MEGMVVHAAAAFPYAYEENMEDLKQALLRTMLELESTRISTKEEMRKNEETMRQMLHLLDVTCRERDEIKIQLQVLLEQLANMNIVHLQPESPTVGSTKVNSGASESGSIPKTHKHRSDVSSPGESLFNSASSSAELPNVNFAESCNMGLLERPFLENYPVFTGLVSNMRGHHSSKMSAPQIVGALRSVDKCIKVKPLPEKGKLLQAVLEAGPLLQTLLIAGPLPRWRNPPPLRSMHVPAISSIQEASCASNPIGQQLGVPFFQLRNPVQD